MKKFFLIFILFFWWTKPAYPFFLTVVGEDGLDYGNKGQEKVWLVFRAEPFQGIVYDVKAPKAKIFTPSGKFEPISFWRTKIKDHATGKKRYAWKARYLPTKIGDYYLVLHSDPTLIPGTYEVWEEIVKVPFHVEREGSWQKNLGLKAEIIPYNRPYGITKAGLFRGRLLLDGKPLSQTLIQVVRFNGVFLTGKELPQDRLGKRDDARMYYSLYTDENGDFSLTFPQEGWWLISAKIPFGNHRIGNSTYPMFLRASMWLYVYPPFELPEGAPKIKAEE
ncbi:DUF4198 domain-containing protein [Thermodesulfatator atlanticus]|uniref:DUF4198 domain-containing protein n=1 Tax=Thermodesulfatator atlanticus TaxID=501497 RepID=UPI0003B5CDDF|nr:DUF4198 domain-containing protein [Thermodesulfatator atlanticus]